MTRRIHILADALADQIAAGEVVERPASVVKELVENALDAAATRVDIRVRNGGKTEIRVADDGAGMGREDAVLALDRHATSKISTPEDLARVRTFGFRGEALPSIASVSRLLVETAEPEEVGTRVRVAGGRVLEVADCARQPGTTVTVQRLFYNTPARAAFLRSAAAETRAIADAVVNMALSQLSVAFRLESNDRTLLELPETSDLASRVADLWGAETAARLVPVDAEGAGARVAGLVERPDAAGTGPRRVHLYVAGRPFRDRALTAAAERAYRTTVARGIRPSLLLYLEVEEGGVDVNVHPAKAEVRFRDRGALEEVIEGAVREALADVSSSATMDVRPTVPQLRRSVGEERGPRPEGQLAFFVPARRPHDEAEAGGPVATSPHGAPSTAEAPEASVPPAGGGEAYAPGAAAGQRVAEPPPVFAGSASLWQVHDTYILAETRGGLLVIDQHSAHERILFEELMRRFETGGAEGQRLLFPITLRLSPAEHEVVRDSGTLFARAGFEMEPFGGRTVVVHSVPNPHPYFEPERCLRDMVTELAAGTALTRAARNQHERIAMTFACKAAVKAGQRLSAAEMRELFDRLFATELPSHDVHGRPTIIRLSLEELERRFGRHG